MVDINLASTADVSEVDSRIADHENNTSNPHQLTASQISAATEAALNNLQSEHDSLEITVTDHKDNWTNPHNVTASQVGVVDTVNAETTLTVDISGDADTIDGLHASDLGSDVSEGGTLVVGKATDLNFTNALNVSDDGDGTVTISGLDKYTNSEAVSAVNAESSLSVSVTGTADSTQSDVDTHIGDTSNPHSVTYSQVDALPLADKGASDGVAELDSNQKVLENQIPSVALTETDVVADQTARLALDAEPGDVAIQEDENQSYILQGDDPSVDSNWKVLKSPTDAVDSVFGRTGSVTAESGDYSVSQITNSASDSQVASVESNLSDHESDTTNPHSVTAAQAGAPTQSEFDTLDTDVSDHTSDTTNPHSVTTSQIGAATDSDLSDHTSDSTNPHGVTASQVGVVSTVNAESSLSVDISGDADTLDGFHAADLGADVSDGGSTVVSNATDLNFGNALNASDDGDGTVTISGLDKYTNSEAVSAVNSETSLSVDISGGADATQSNLDSHTSDTSNPHSVTASQVGAPTTSDLDSHTSSSNPHSGSASETWVNNNFNDYSNSQAISAVEGQATTTLKRLEVTTNTIASEPDIQLNANAGISAESSLSYFVNSTSGDFSFKFGGINNDDATSTPFTINSDGTVNASVGPLQEGGDRVATRTWANSNFDDYTDSEAVSAVNAETSLSVDISGAASATQSNLDSHTSNTSNPHSVTASQVGAAPESHTSDTTNPHSVTASQVGAVSQSELDSHTGDSSNPHAVTLEQARSQSNAISGDIAFNNSYTIGEYSASSLVITDDDGTDGWYFENDGNFDSASITSNSVTSDDVQANSKLGVPQYQTRADIPDTEEGLFFVVDEGGVILRTNEDVGTTDPQTGDTQIDNNLYVGGELYATSNNHQVYHEGNFNPDSASDAVQVEATDGSLIHGNENPEYASVSDAEAAGLLPGTTVWIDGELYVEDGT